MLPVIAIRLGGRLCFIRYRDIDSVFASPTGIGIVGMRCGTFLLTDCAALPLIRHFRGER